MTRKYMEIKSGSVPLTHDDSQHKNHLDVFSPVRIAFAVYAAVALSISVYLYWPNCLIWLSK